MQRRSKSIVVKQRGAAGAGSLPTGDVNSAGTAQAVVGPGPGLRAGRPRKGRPGLCPFCPPDDSLHSCQIYLEQEVST